MRTLSLGDIAGIAVGTAIDLATKGLQSDRGSVFVRGGTTTAVTIEVSDDGTNWATAQDINGGDLSGLDGVTRVVAGNHNHIRANRTAGTGTANIRLVLPN